MIARVAGLVVLVVSTLAACKDGSYLTYGWDDRRVLCSDSIDDLSSGSQLPLVDDQMRLAADEGRVALFHAHKPGITVSRDMIEQVLDLADHYGLEYVTYDQLVPGPRRPAFALAFDDNSVDLWLSIRDLLAAHHARVTFFVSRYAFLTDEQRAGLATLAADGNDLEPHSVRHLHPLAYVRDHGVDGYLDDEVLPSVAAMAAAGYSTTTFAYPFGQRTDALDDAVLGHVAKVRVSPGSCPW